MARPEVTDALAELRLLVAQGFFSKERRLGVEQEIFLLDLFGHPSAIAHDIATDDDHVEAGAFVIERATKAFPLDGRALMEIASDLLPWIADVKRRATGRRARAWMGGLVKSERPIVLTDQRLREIAANVPDLAAATRCASYQINLSTTPEAFADDYRFACAIAGPLVALHSPHGDPRLAQLAGALGAERMGFPRVWPTDLPGALEEIAAQPAISISQRRGVGLLDDLSKDLWRWVRPRIEDRSGEVSLRLEVRPLCAGPDLMSELATTAIFVGLMCATRRPSLYPWAYVTPEEATANIVSAGRDGLRATLSYGAGRESVIASELCRYLVGHAAVGLAELGVEPSEIRVYMDILAARR